MESLQPKPPKVFISYSHDSQEHEDRVLALANRLRAEGIDAQIDQYESAPALGWARWTSKEIGHANYVLVVCTDVYRRRAEHNEDPGVGRGVLWEVNLIYNDLYLHDT